MSAFPPIYTQKGLNVTPDTALLYLSAYLNSSKTSPHLLPNARLEASGPTAGSSNASVTIHNLQRVEAGLKGEWLAPKLELEEEEVKQIKKLKGGEETEEWQDLDQYQREQSIEGPEFAQEDLGVEDDGDVEGENDFYGKGGEDVDENVEMLGATAAKGKSSKKTVDVDGDVEMVEEATTPKAKTPKKSSEVVQVKKIEAPRQIDPEARKKAKKDRLKAERKAKNEERRQAKTDA